LFFFFFPFVRDEQALALFFPSPPSQAHVRRFVRLGSLRRVDGFLFIRRRPFFPFFPLPEYIYFTLEMDFPPLRNGSPFPEGRRLSFALMKPKENTPPPLLGDPPRRRRGAFCSAEEEMSFLSFPPFPSMPSRLPGPALFPSPSSDVTQPSFTVRR